MMEGDLGQRRAGVVMGGVGASTSAGGGREMFQFDGQVLGKFL